MSVRCKGKDNDEDLGFRTHRLLRPFSAHNNPIKTQNNVVGDHGNDKVGMAKNNEDEHEKRVRVG